MPEPLLLLVTLVALLVWLSGLDDLAFDVVYYASPELIRAYRGRLGDILLEHRRLNPDTLSRALAEQERVGKRLGELLVAQGAVDKARATQRPATLPRVSEPGPLPPRQCLQGCSPGGPLGGLVVAAAEPLSPVARDALREATGMTVTEVLAPDDDIQFALERLYRESPQAVAAGRTPRLGAVLLGLGLVATDELVEALRVQYHTGKPLGQILHRESAVGW